MTDAFEVFQTYVRNVQTKKNNLEQTSSDSEWTPRQWKNVIVSRLRLE